MKITYSRNACQESLAGPLAGGEWRCLILDDQRAALRDVGCAVFE